MMMMMMMNHTMETIVTPLRFALQSALTLAVAHVFCGTWWLVVLCGFQDSVSLDAPLEDTINSYDAAAAAATTFSWSLQCPLSCTMTCRENGNPINSTRRERCPRRIMPRV
jgi:hypothetical protein